MANKKKTNKKMFLQVVDKTFDFSINVFLTRVSSPCIVAALVSQVVCSEQGQANRSDVLIERVRAVLRAYSTLLLIPQS